MKTHDAAVVHKDRELLFGFSMIILVIVKDPVLRCQMPTLDFTLCLRIIGRTLDTLFF